MYPVLVVEGVAHKVEGIDWTESGLPHVAKIKVNGKSVFYYNSLLSPEADYTIDLTKHLNFGERSLIRENIGKRIEALEEKMLEYESDLMAEFKECRKNPFASDRMIQLADEHEALSQIVEGLHEALGIVVESDYMEEDVDLSGDYGE